jgi:hypothetical protein
MEILDLNKKLQLHTTMYPCSLENFKSDQAQRRTYPAYTTVYGFVFEGQIHTDQYTVLPNQYFCLTSTTDQDLTLNFKEHSHIVLIERIGFKGQNQVGGPVEGKGRLTYIDGCSDSLLVYPPRLGDPSLNYLFFPPGIDQTFHVHPSVRLGTVIEGSGHSDVQDATGNTEVLELNKGVVFCLNEMELHRFRTNNSNMKIIAWHPDGDWGPTDHNHTMLNRTYIQK